MKAFYNIFIIFNSKLKLSLFINIIYLTVVLDKKSILII